MFLSGIALYGYVQNISCVCGIYNYSTSKITVFGHYVTVKKTLALLQLSWLLYKSIQLSQINNLSTNQFWNARSQPGRKMLTVTNLKNKLGEAVADGVWRDVQVGHFIKLRLPVSQLLPRLLFFFIFSAPRMTIGSRLHSLLTTVRCFYFFQTSDFEIIISLKYQTSKKNLHLIIQVLSKFFL